MDSDFKFVYTNNAINAIVLDNEPIIGKTIYQKNLCIRRIKDIEKTTDFYFFRFNNSLCLW